MLTHDCSERLVTINRTQSGFGLTICGGADFPHKEGDSGIFVSEVSRPDIDLSVGDRILEANTVSLRDVSHDEAISALKSSADALRLIVEPAQLDFNSSSEDLFTMGNCTAENDNNRQLIIESITEVDFGTREDNAAISQLEDEMSIEIENEEKDTSTFSKVFGTVAFVALGAVLVTMVLRKPVS